MTDDQAFSTNSTFSGQVEARETNNFSNGHDNSQAEGGVPGISRNLEPESSEGVREQDMTNLQQVKNGTNGSPSLSALGQYRTESQGSYNLSNESSSGVVGSAHFRPIFLGNLDLHVTAEEISDIFTRPALDVPPMPVERVDLKRGFAFVFLKDAKTQEDKERVQRYIDGIQGLYVYHLPLCSCRPTTVIDCSA